MHKDFIGIEIDKLFIPFIGKINNDIENNLIDKDVWKKASKKTSLLVSNYLWSLLDYHFEGLSAVKSFRVVKQLLS